MALRRIFVAVAIPEDTRHALAALLVDTVGEIPGRAVPPRNWHLTLRFLGEIESVALDRLLAEIDGADLGSPFEVVWSGFGAFPRPTRATVIWLGVDRGGEDLALLADAVNLAADHAGFPPEDRPFRPHLTLSRLRPPEDVSELVTSGDGVSVRMPVSAVTVYQSRFGEQGVAYRVVEEIPIG